MQRCFRPNALVPSIAPKALRTAPLAAWGSLAVVALLLAFAPATLTADEAPDAAQSATEPSEGSDFLHEQLQPFLSNYCLHCHSGDEAAAGLPLDVYDDQEAMLRDRTVFDKVIENLKFGIMPPEDEYQPSKEEVTALVEALQEELIAGACDGPTDPGRVTIRRLNRAEYNNTIRDLIGVDFNPAEDFPSDDVGYGFDNIGDVLSMPPILLEKYLAAAARIVEEAIVTRDPHAPVTRRFEAYRDEVQGGRLRDTSRVLASSGGVSLEVEFPYDAHYLLRVGAYAQQAGDELAKMGVRLDGQQLTAIEVPAVSSEPGVYEHRVHVERGKHTLAAAFLNDYYRPDDPDPKNRDRNLYITHFEIEGPLDLPPAPLPESHTRIIFRQPKDGDDDACAREILQRFASRAFRRPVTSEELEGLVNLYKFSRTEGDNFEEAIGLAVSAVLVSPHFLFRIELDRPELEADTRLLDDYELATRLSYFLWSSMPDDELFDLAAAGALRDNLESQVRRMLADPKSRALVDNFGGQWLTTRNLERLNPDPELFPNFDEELRAAMLEETSRFFEYILREDRSIVEFLDADFTFVNERLARHYGLEGVEGPEFRQVALPDNRRGGLLSQASILTITSNPTRTSPVKRGKWVLEQLLGSPPPPPPPDVPELEEEDQAELTGTLRERMEQHRANPGCASCHQRMDPLGFGLENYDAIGAWRERDGEHPIDASGVLPSGHSFDGPAELRQVLLEKADEFRRCLAEKMLTYALGRGLEYYDRCAVDEIVERTAEQQDRFSALILAVVESDPFTRRRNTRDHEEPVDE